MATHSSILTLENLMDRGAWQATAHGVARVRHDLATKPPLHFKVNLKVISEESLPLELQVMLLVIYLVWKRKWPGASKLPQSGKR